MSSILEQSGAGAAGEFPAWRAARQRRMLHAAIEALRADQADALSMDDIARAAGVGKATLYRYFDSKEGLLRACLADVVDKLGARMEAAEATDAAPPERLRRIIAAMVEAFSRDLLPLRPVAGRQGLMGEEWRRSVRAARQRLDAVLDRHFRHGRETGHYRDLDLVLVPHLIMGMIRSGVTHSGLDNDQVTAGIHDFVLRGCRGPGADR